LDAFVVVVYRYGQDLFRSFLTDDVVVEEAEDFCGLGNIIKADFGGIC
jgi:hypothetical protein